MSHGGESLSLESEPPTGASRLAAALQLAWELHGGQRRKGTEIPYVAHLLGVASLVLEHGGDEDQVIAALLHDGPEDQGGRPVLDRIRHRFGERVAGIVEDCSDSLASDPRRKPAWEDRKRRYLAHLDGSLGEGSLLVSLADKVHNLGSTLDALRDPAVGETVWRRFRRSRESTLWYYRELLERFEARRTPALTPLIEEMRLRLSAIEAHGGRAPD